MDIFSKFEKKRNLKKYKCEENERNIKIQIISFYINNKA